MKQKPCNSLDITAEMSRLSDFNDNSHPFTSEVGLSFRKSSYPSSPHISSYPEGSTLKFNPENGLSVLRSRQIPGCGLKLAHPF